MSAGFYSPDVVQTGQVPSTQTNFPQLFLPSGSDRNRFRTEANGGRGKSASGYDIRWSTSTALTYDENFELVQGTFNATTGDVEMWRLKSSLADGSTDYVSNGDASLTTDGSSTSVWPSQYKGVYHLGDSPTGSAPQHHDSTSNTKDLTVTTNSGSPATTTGEISNAANYPSASQYTGTFSTNTSAIGVGGTKTFTISGWVKFNSFLTLDGYPNFVFGILDTVSQTGASIAIDAANKISFNLTNFATFGYKNSGISAALSTGTWYYAVGVDDGTNISAYLNASATSTATDGAITNSKAILGGNLTTLFGDRFNDAQYDELHYHNTNVTANWITTEYNNQSAPGTFSVLGTEVAVGGASPTYPQIERGIRGLNRGLAQAA